MKTILALCATLAMFQACYAAPVDQELKPLPAKPPKEGESKPLPPPMSPSEGEEPESEPESEELEESEQPEEENEEAGASGEGKEKYILYHGPKPFTLTLSSFKFLKNFHLK